MILKQVAKYPLTWKSGKKMPGIEIVELSHTLKFWLVWTACTYCAARKLHMVSLQQYLQEDRIGKLTIKAAGPKPHFFLCWYVIEICTKKVELGLCWCELLLACFNTPCGYHCELWSDCGYWMQDWDLGQTKFTAVFGVKSWQPKAKKNAKEPQDKYHNECVYDTVLWQLP